MLTSFHLTDEWTESSSIVMIVLKISEEKPKAELGRSLSLHIVELRCPRFLSS